MERATVLGVNRTTQRAKVQLLGGPTANAVYLGEPPPPRGICWVDQSQPGAWIVVGTETTRQPTVRENFQVALDLTAALGVGAVLCDTSWFSQGTLGAITVAAPPTIPGSVGLLTLISSAAGAGTFLDMCKGDLEILLPSLTLGAVWMSGRFMLSTLANALYGLGFANNARLGFAAPGAGAADVRLFFDSAAFANSFGFLTVNGAASTVIDTKVPAVAGVMYEFDIVVEREWAGLWLNGDGPYVIATNVPSTLGFQPRLAVFPRAAASIVLTVDWLNTDLLGPLAPAA